MARKLTDEIAIEMQRRHRDGATYDDLARAFGCSQGTVRNGLRRKVRSGKGRRDDKAKVAAAAADAPTQDEAARAAAVPTTIDELRAELARQAAELRADLKAAKEPAVRARLNRHLLTLRALEARLIPDDTDPDKVVVSRAELEASVRKASKRFHSYIDHVAAKTEALPKCPTCKQPIREAP